MKKFTALLLSVLMLLAVFVSCDVDVDPQDSSSQPEQPNTTVTNLDLNQRFFLFDKEEMYKRLYSLYVSDADPSITVNEAKNLLAFMEGWAYEGSPVGGYEYQGKIYTQAEATYVCATDGEFQSAVKKAKSGDVIFIPSGVTIDMGDLFETENYLANVAEGVIIASDRGVNDGGALIFSNPSGAMLTCANNVVITGLNISGVIAISGQHDASEKDNGIKVNGTNVTVSNCEIAAFSGSGITVASGASVTIDNCFIHDNVIGIEVIENNAAITNNAFFKNGIDLTDSSNTAELPSGNVRFETATPAESLVEQVNPDITSALYPVDSYEVYLILEDIAAGNTSRVIDALSTHAGTTRYYEFKDQLTIEQNGEIYGISDNSSPVGGGVGYANIYTTGDYVVDTYDELVTALGSAKSGEVVFVSDGAKIDVTAKNLTVPAGVILASNRGYVYEDGSVSTGGMIYTTHRVKSYDRAILMMEGSTITGLTVAGTDTVRHMDTYYRGLSGGSYTNYYYKLFLTRGIHTGSSNVTVTNCEISGFSEAGVSVDSGAQNVTVSNCYIHHNQRMGYGYGVVLYSSNTQLEIYRNLFNFDRHAIAADGKPGSGYIAKDNIHMGTAIFHIFDAHGGRDRGDGTDIACKYVEMTNNVFLSDKIPYKKRGTPSEHSIFTNNIIIYPETSYEWRQMYGNNFVNENNIWGLEQPVIPEYNFENGETFTITIKKPVLMYKYEDQTFITSKGAALRYKYFLVFTPKGDGTYYISEYGNNLDDGSIYGYDEKVLIPEGGFVISFANHAAANKLYKSIQSVYGVIYNTSLPVNGDFIATLEDNKLTVTKGVAVKE